MLQLLSVEEGHHVDELEEESGGLFGLHFELEADEFVGHLLEDLGEDLGLDLLGARDQQAVDGKVKELLGLGQVLFQRRVGLVLVLLGGQRGWELLFNRLPAAEEPPHPPR